MGMELLQTWPRSEEGRRAPVFSQEEEGDGNAVRKGPCGHGAEAGTRHSTLEKPRDCGKPREPGGAGRVGV